MPWKLWNVESRFQGANTGKKTSFWVLFHVQKWCDLRWRCSMLRMSISEQNRWINGLNELIHKKRRITVCDVANMLGISLLLIHIILKESEHALDCCQICFLLAKWGAIGELCQHVPVRAGETWKEFRIHFKGSQMWWDLGLQVWLRN